MSKFTPGPWHYEGLHVWAGDDPANGAITQGGCGCCNGMRDGVYEEADARLIAAAPDLLEALIDAVCALECCGKDYPAAEKARAAIAKARGES